MTPYITRAGDMLDLICRLHYGPRTGMVEAVLEANYALSDQPELLPAGLTIMLPDAPQQQPAPLQKLWD